ncbi:hypothetical protein SUGI_0111140 [Cryptomeria japonica]|nr:hypothetical protein SUGI_0111140 [Cryptomeria japonica]
MCALHECQGRHAGHRSVHGFVRQEFFPPDQEITSGSETTTSMDVDDDDNDEVTTLVEFSPPSTPKFSPMSEWDISDFGTLIRAALGNM